ncbi:hypothetical protein FZEAL_8202 [Fusarium zealandicum]|uniref:Uncharacterized protein n=1 Tax=Fusarium zealandicum TaxID=1053134 RepID=A0A8H4UEY1_9HYPO|nr:hypothetical protein FZEAL_8202 [Fusarium zealandicum]
MPRGRGRPSYLPPVENPAGTYYEADSINFLIENRLSVGNNEAQVRQTWLNILAHNFPPVDGYMIAAEADAGSGRLDVQVSEVVYQGRRDESIFFVVECKNPRYEGAIESWEDAVEQLFGYLAAVARRERLRPGGRKWGAVSIGKSVQFWKYVEGELSLRPLHSNALRLDRQYQSVQQWLDYIKERS